MHSLLEISGLEVFYGPVRALHSISLKVPQGAVACLIGANGAGKSTVLKAVSGLVRPRRGNILFNGSSILDVPAHQRVAMGLVQCPEGRGVFPNLAVAENLDLGAYTRRDKPLIARDLRHVLEIFPRLADRLKQPAGTLSGGEQQMLAIARALMARPSLLLLDEPSLGLAPQMVAAIFDTIARINQEGTTILLVEQNAHLALGISNLAYVLETGKILLHGPADKIASDKRVREAYLGESV